MPADRSDLSRRLFLKATGAIAAAGVGGAGILQLAAPASAAPAPPAGIPFLHGYDAAALKVWTPETDPYAKYFRSRVPLADRIATFAPTQANPSLDHRPQYLSLANDYMEAENAVLAHKYGYSFEAYALRFWQYVDFFASWHGLPVYGEYGKSDPRYGVINLPNPAWTDAAHRNGVKSLGCWFWPRTDDFEQLVTQADDGSFAVGDKLIEMARYFGFDGYFINQEGDITADQAARLLQMWSYMRQTAPAGFHLQWYDSLTTAGHVSYQNEFDAVNAPWIVQDGKRYCSSTFLNYWWSQAKIQRSHDYADSLGLDPYETVFAGTEAGGNNFSQPYDPRWVFPEGGDPLLSWATLGAEMVWSIVPGTKNTVETQQPVYTYERQYWSGPRQDPSQSGRSLPPTGKDNLNPERWDGVAHYIVEKSVVGSYPFLTRFNAGTGQRFFIDGTLSGQTPWYNIGIQDLLPTWQWWLRNSDGTPADELTIDYDYENAFDGGTSLRASGALSAGKALELRLFKTDLRVDSDVVLSITYAGQKSSPSVGLTFADASDQVIWLDQQQTNGQGWSRVTWPLGRYAGRTIAAISLGFRSVAAIDAYVIRIGELRVERAHERFQPRAPRNFTVAQLYVADDVATAFFSWQFAGPDIWYYDLFQIGDSGRQWIGRTYDENYVVPGLTRQSNASTVIFEIVAVARDGSRSGPTQAVAHWK